MTKGTIGVAVLALMTMAAAPAFAWDGDVGPLLATGMCAESNVGELRDDADAKVGQMRTAVDEVRDLRDFAQDSGNVSNYQRLNNLYTQMNSRLLVAEQAREGLANSDDRNSLESDCGLIDAAYTSVMGSLDEAGRVVSGGVTGGDEENLLGGANGLPSYDTTTRGRTTALSGAEDGREDASFGRGTPFS